MIDKYYVYDLIFGSDIRRRLSFKNSLRKSGFVFNTKTDPDPPDCFER